MGELPFGRLRHHRHPARPIPVPKGLPSAWTRRCERRRLGCMTNRQMRSSAAPDERLTPWLLHDLPRIAWIVEYRSAELTEAERTMVQDSVARIRRALERDTDRPKPDDL
jgi:hypothetical protein